MHQLFFDHELDARTQASPWPVLSATRLFNSMQGGEILKVIATDVLAVKDFDALIRIRGLQLLGRLEQDGEFLLLIRKPDMKAHANAHTASHRQDIRADHVIDARHLSCPLPVLTTRKSVDGLQPGEVLKVISSDRGAPAFFESLSRQTGLQLVGWHEEGDDYSFFLRKP